MVQMTTNWMNAAEEIKRLETQIVALKKDGPIIDTDGVRDEILRINNEIWGIAMLWSGRIKGLVKALAGRGTPKARNGIERCLTCFDKVIGHTVDRHTRITESIRLQKEGGVQG